MDKKHYQTRISVKLVWSFPKTFKDVQMHAVENIDQGPSKEGANKMELIN